jgi:hypothetical protein
VTLDGQPAQGGFDYRIVAKRLGYETLRLEPTADPNQAQEMILGQAAAAAPEPNSEPGGAGHE